jgi:hypothetical protein
MDRMEDKLDAVWVAYKDACPDPEASPDFMPKLWGRIEARRAATLSIFRRLSQVCVMATVALTLLMTVVLIPHLQKLPVYSATYVDVLAADLGLDYTDILGPEDAR